VCKFLAQGHKPWHFILGQTDLVPTGLGKAKVSYFKFDCGF
jgi:hypothetical protein